MSDARRSDSKLGKVSVGLAAIAGLAAVGTVLLLFFAAFYAALFTDDDLASLDAPGIGLLVFFSAASALILSFPAFVLGVAGTVHRRRRKRLAILGATLSALTFFAACAFFVFVFNFG